MSHFTRCALFTFCGILLAIGGAMTIASEEGKRKGLKNGGYVLMTIAMIGYMLFGFMMLVTFRWGYLITGIFISGSIAAAVIALHYGIQNTVQKTVWRVLLSILLTVVQLVLYVICLFPVSEDEKMVGSAMSLGISAVLAVVYFLNKLRYKRRRSRILTDSPVMQQVVEICRRGSCVAVQILPDRVRLFNKLPDLDFCKTEDYDALSCEFKPPRHWMPWFEGGAWNLELTFREYNYPSMTEEQMELCAQGMVKRLRRFTSCHHHSAYRHTDKPYYDKTKNAYVTVTHVTHLYDDWLLYHLPTYRAETKREMEKREARVKETQATVKHNNWE